MTAIVLAVLFAACESDAPVGPSETGPSANRSYTCGDGSGSGPYMLRGDTNVTDYVWTQCNGACNLYNLGNLVAGSCYNLALIGKDDICRPCD